MLTQLVSASAARNTDKCVSNFWWIWLFMSTSAQQVFFSQKDSNFDKLKNSDNYLYGPSEQTPSKSCRHSATAATRKNLHVAANWTNVTNTLVHVFQHSSLLACQYVLRGTTQKAPKFRVCLVLNGQSQEGRAVSLSSKTVRAILIGSWLLRSAT